MMTWNMSCEWKGAQHQWLPNYQGKTNHTHTPIKFSFTNIRVTVTKRQDTDVAEWGSRENTTTIPCWEECRPEQPLCKTELNKQIKNWINLCHVKYISVLNFINL